MEVIITALLIGAYEVLRQGVEVQQIRVKERVCYAEAVKGAEQKQTG